MGNWSQSSWKRWIACVSVFALLATALIAPAPEALAAGTLEWTKGSAGAGDGQFSTATGIDVDPVSHYFAVADLGNNRIQFFAPDGTFSYAYGGPADTLFHPLDVLFDGQGHLYISDQNSVRKFDISYSASVWTITQSVKWDGTGGTAPVGGLNNAYAMALYGTTLYVADQTNNRVLQIPNMDSFSASSEASSFIASITRPAGLAADGTGLYVSSEEVIGHIFKYDTTGHLQHTSSAIYFPNKLRLGSDGYLYATHKPLDIGGLMRLTPELDAIEDISGSYTYLFAKAVALDQINGRIYAVDSPNNQLIKYNVGSFDNKLSEMSISNGTLSPSFDSDTANYTANVGNETSSVTVTPTAADGTATIQVNSTTVASGGLSGSIPLNVGANTITVDDIAANGAKRKYTIVVTRAASSNALLSNLATSAEAFNESFASTTMDYTMGVPYATTALTVTPTVADGTATATVNDSTVTSGIASGAIALSVSSNSIPIVVTAQNGTSKTYTIHVTRQSASVNADLSALSLSSGTLDPAFDSGTTSYTADVANAVTSFTVTPTVADTTATVAVNGSTVASSSASGAINLNVGDNPIMVVVTAENGTSTKSYNITVTRAASSNADLSDLRVSSGELNEPFAAATTSYTQRVANSVTSLTVTPTVADPTASLTIAVNGGASTPVDSGNPSAAILLNVGANTIKVEVTAEDLSIQTYTIRVTRISNDALLPSSGGNDSSPTVPKPVIDQNGITLDPDKIDTTKPSLTLEVTPKDGVAYINIPASILKSLEGKSATFFIEIKTSYGSYQVPVNLASLIPGLQDLLTANNLKAEDISFKITLTDKSGNKDIQAAFEEGLPYGSAMGAIVDFSIEIMNTKTNEVIRTANQFSKALTRIIPMQKNITGMPEQWGAFRYNETTKEFAFVPARKVQIDSVWYVMISSFTNSVYAVAHNPVSFSDVQKHWSESYVELAAAKGLVDGVGGGMYEPDRTVTRAEFTFMLIRALGHGIPTGSTSSYDDVKPDAWYFDAVTKAEALGLLDFSSGKSFMPNQPLTREEMASMLAAAVTLEKLSTPNQQVNLDGYKDIASVKAAYLENVRMMVQLNIMIGTGKDKFSPKGETTRAQAAVVFIRTLQALGWMD